MNDIEKKLREGISVEDLIKEINETKAKLEKEEKAREEEKIKREKAEKKIAEARIEMINAIVKYLQALDMNFTEKEIKSIISNAEKYCREYEKSFRTINSLNLSDKDLVSAFRTLIWE